MKHETESFIAALEKAFGAVGKLKCTPTVLNKGNPDANLSIRKFALLFGVDYNELPFGDGERHATSHRWAITVSSSGPRSRRPSRANVSTSPLDTNVC